MSNPHIDLSAVPAEFAAKVLELSDARNAAKKMYEASKADTKALKDAFEETEDNLLDYLDEIRAENPLFDGAKRND